MKLYEVPNKTWVKSIEPDCEVKFFFDHLDGMYSFCLDEEGKVVHYSASMNVELVDIESTGIRHGDNDVP